MDSPNPHSFSTSFSPQSQGMNFHLAIKPSRPQKVSIGSSLYWWATRYIPGGPAIETTKVLNDLIKEDPNRDYK